MRSSISSISSFWRIMNSGTRCHSRNMRNRMLGWHKEGWNILSTWLRRRGTLEEGDRGSSRPGSTLGTKNSDTNSRTSRKTSKCTSTKTTQWSPREVPERKCCRISHNITERCCIIRSKPDLSQPCRGSMSARGNQLRSARNWRWISRGNRSRSTSTRKISWRTWTSRRNPMTTSKIFTTKGTISTWTRTSSDK